MNSILKISCLICINLVLITTGFAQDRSAAKAYNEGLALLKEKNYIDGFTLMEEALTLAEGSDNEKVIRLAKKNGSVAASNIGNSKYKEGDFTTALEYYMKGIALNPENPSNAVGKARVLNKEDKKTEAVSAFIEAGDIYVSAGKPERAKKVYKQAQNLVGKLFVAKEYDRAIEAGNAFVAVKKNAEVYYYLSKSFLNQKNNDMALDYINNAIELANSGESVPDKYYMALGQSLEKLGKSSEAISAYKKIKGEKYKAQADYKVKTLQG